MKPYSLKARILVPISLALALLLAAFVVSFHRFQQNHLNDMVLSKLESVQELFAAQLESDAGMMGAALDAILVDEQLKAALKAKDRIVLLDKSLTLFGQWNTEHDITHLYFTGADRVNILRVHKPEKYGDRIDRFTTLEAEETGRVSHGIELGPLGTFTLRVVQPWYDGQQLIGYVELGEEIEHVTQKVHNVLGVEIYIVIAKKYLDRAGWESGMRMLGRDANWNRFPSVVMIDRTQEELPEGLSGFFDEEEHVSMKTDVDMLFNDRRYRTRFIHLNDAGGRGVGDMVVMTDVTELVAHLHFNVFMIVAICVGVGGLLFALLLLYIQRVEQAMVTARGALAESEDRFRTLFNSAADAVFIHDFEGQMQEVNRLACDRLGYSRDELLRMKPKDFNAPEEASRIPERFKELQNKGYIRFETTHVNRNGKLIPVEVISRTIGYKGKGMAISAARDITERKQAEEALRKVSEEQTILLDNIDTLVWYLTDLENNGAVNRALADFFGVQKSDIAYKNLYDILGKEEAEVCIAGNREVFESKRQIRTEEWARNGRGERRLLSISKTPKLDKDGNVEYVVCAAEDITERKQTEEALEQSEEKVRTFMDSATDLFAITDENENLVYVNKSMAESLEYSMDEMIGMHIAEVISEESMINFQTEMAELVTRGQLNIESTWLTKQGREIPGELNVNAIFDKDGKYIGSRGVFRDTSERKQLMEELKEHRDHLQKSVEERTAELLEANEQLQQEITERKLAQERLLTYHKRLRSLASSLSLAEEQERRRIATEVHDLIGQNLAFAKLKLAALLGTSSGSAREAVKEVNGLVDEAIRDSRFLVSELGAPVLYELGLVAGVEWLTQQTQKRYGITIDCQDDGQPKPVRDDIRVLLFQAVRELLANVVRHAKAQRTKVSITKNHHRIQIDVEDDGVGFNPEETIPGGDENVFGLFSIRERLEPLGGYMKVSSEPGHGTRVTIMGPLKSES
jgi:PAS domain S-box-containing protein